MHQLDYKAYTEHNKPVDFSYTMEGAGCCILVDEKVLLIQRSAHHKIQAGTWGIPAGKLDSGETPIQAALRETHEETGIVLNSDAVQYCGHIYFFVSYEKPLQYRFHVYTIHLQEYPQVTLEPDQVAFFWVTLEEASQLPVFTGTREVLSLGMK